MPCSNSFRTIPRKAFIGFRVPMIIAGTATFALLVTLPEEAGHDAPGPRWQLAQEKGTGKGKGKGGGGEGAQKQKHNTADETWVSDDESRDGGKHCPQGQAAVPLRGRGGSGSVRGAGCM
jgi:hypothetical protein